jgi:hypothetical protein
LSKHERRAQDAQGGTEIALKTFVLSVAKRVHREDPRVAKENSNSRFKAGKTFASFAPWRFKDVGFVLLIFGEVVLKNVVRTGT